MIIIIIIMTKFDVVLFLYLFYLWYLSYWRGRVFRSDGNKFNQSFWYTYLITCIAHSPETNKTLPAIAHVSMIRWTEAMLLGSEPMFLGQTRLLGRMVASRQLAHHRAEWCPAAIL